MIEKRKNNNIFCEYKKIRTIQHKSPEEGEKLDKINETIEIRNKKNSILHTIN